MEEETHGPVAVDMSIVHALSIEQLKHLEDKEVSMLVGALAALLTVGRLFSEKRMDEEEEMKFVEAMMHYVEFYFMPSNGTVAS